VEVLQRAAGAGGQLLRVDRLPPPGVADDAAAAFLLTFDVGRILVAADPAGGGLASTHIAGAGAIPGGLADASEVEPWWRLLGCPLARVSAATDSIGIRLHFTLPSGRSRTLALTLSGSRVRAALEASS
jgi:hypothetical protein